MRRDRRKLNLTSPAYRGLQRDAIEVYKYIQGIYRVEYDDILPRHHNKSLKPEDIV